MQLEHKIPINFLDFFKTGKFDYLKIGQTKEYIINNFPDPDCFNKGVEFLNHNSIWTYGNIELHFNKENKLWMIFSDYINTLNGGDNLILEKWILEKPQKLTLLKVIEHLNKEHIDFEKRTEKTINQIKIKILKSHVELYFLPDEKKKKSNPNVYMLNAFSLM